MPTLTEGKTPGDFLLFEEQDHYSREEVTIAAGADLEPGTVLGMVTATEKYVASNEAGADGSEAAAAVLMTPAAAAEAAVKEAVVALDKAAQKGAIHHKNAARRKSRLEKQLNSASGG